MNRARQESITTEIIEIVGGAEALAQAAIRRRRTSSSTAPFAPDLLATPPGASMTVTESPETELKDGRIVAIVGPVVDVEFPPDALPELNGALEFDVEVEGETTDHRRRGRPAHRRQPGACHLHEAHRRPQARHAGEATSAAASPCRSATATLGHVFNVIGEPLDTRGEPHRGPRRAVGDPPPRAGASTTSTPRPRCSRPASRSSTSSSPTARAARSACSAAPAWARP